MTEWNEGQTEVLNSLGKDHNILVSAAAGSGKTAVLVERIVRSVEQGLCGIDEILVVTFTKAAAAQMKGKIIRLLEERAYDSKDPKLLRQLSMAANADISTIDSFCNRVVRENFQLVGVDPGFDVLDAGEESLLMEEVMDTVLDRLYREEDFAAFARAFIRRTYDDSGLRDLIRKIYRVSEGFAEPEKWIERHRIRKTDTPEQVLERDWAVEMLQIIRRSARSAVSCLERERDRYAGETDPEKRSVAEKITAVLDADREWMDSIVKAEDLFEISGLPPVPNNKFMKSSYIKVYEPAEIESLSKCRTKLRNEMKELINSVSVAAVAEEISCHAEVEEHLIHAVRAFREALDQEKQRRKKYDFSDIAHFAFRILYDPQRGQVTETGRRYAAKYRFIYIDEYQDGSDIQEHILNSVARLKDGRTTNIFMVGDVKQSIYRFRQARPQLFLEKERDYRKGDEEGSDGQVLFLNRNYRSRNEILEAVNYVFRRLMREDFGGIIYDENVQLNPPKGREKMPGPEVLPELLILDPEETEEAEAAVPVSSDILEARMIGNRILELVKGDSPYSFRDIVILQRSVSGCGPMLREYEKMGIPVQLEDPKAYFDAEEVMVILSVLQTIDNTRQDIPYATVLRSEIGGCTDAELGYLAMQRKGRTESLFETAAQVLEDGTGRESEDLAGLRCSLLEKLSVLHSFLEKWRRESLYLSISQLIDRILEDSGYRLVAAGMPWGQRREANLMQLMFKAEDFEKAGNHGLFHFLRYIEKCRIHEVAFGESGGLAEQSDAVRICTIHSSKGLEYPVVFVSRLGKQFNLEDLKGMVMVSADYGMAPNRIRRIGEKYWLSEKGVLRNAVNRLEKQEGLYEELRLFYVAMTRAKERLILTGKRKGFQNDWQEAHFRKTGSAELSYGELTSAKTYLDFLAPILLGDPEGAAVHFSVNVHMAADIRRQREEEPVISPETTAETEKGDSEAVIPEEAAEKLRARAEMLKAGYEYRYPYQAAVVTKTKLSVSEIKHEAMELGDRSFDTEPQVPVEPVESLEEPEKARKQEAENTPEKPGESLEEPEKALEEASGKARKEKAGKAQKAAGISGAEYGTAVHKLMELLPFGEIDSPESMRRVLLKLLKGPFFTEDLRKAIHVDTIKQFYSEDPGSLFQRMRQADQRRQLYREQQFLVGLPADRLGQELPLREAEVEDAARQRVTAGGTLRFATKEPVVLQGVIDAFFLEQDAEGQTYAVLMDYKTDRVETPELLIDRYRAQISLYKETLEDILHVPVREMWLYGFSRGLGEIQI